MFEILWFLGRFLRGEFWFFACISMVLLKIIFLKEFLYQIYVGFKTIHRCFKSWNQSISDQPHSWLKSLNDLNFYPSNHIILWIVPFFSVMKQRSLRLHFLPKVNSTCHLNLKFKVSEWNSTDF